MTKPATSKPTKKQSEGPSPPEESANASLPNEGTGTPLLHRLPPSSGSAGAKKG
jgi:hypothetical protein